MDYILFVVGTFVGGFFFKLGCLTAEALVRWIHARYMLYLLLKTKDDMLENAATVGMLVIFCLLLVGVVIALGGPY